MGIFGKYGVYIATYFYNGNYVDAAIKMHTNYDGAHSKFGDTEVYSTDSDKVNSSIYASVFNGNDYGLHLIIINKNLDNPINGTFNITSPQKFVSGRVWRFDSNDCNIVETAPISSIANNSFTYSIPALTVCHIVLQAHPVGDLSGDFHVDINDLDIFCDQWLHSGDCSADPNCADLNKNYYVNFTDFAILGRVWGM